MPLINQSFYRPPLYLRSGHLQIFIAALMQRATTLSYERERIETPDGDFLDLDWLRTGASRLAVLCHGLEGNTRSGYIVGMAAALQKRGWDVLAWNYRSCGEELNRTARFYHSGATDDLETVLQHAFRVHPAKEIALLGFSLGGNLVLKYLGERAHDSRIQRAVTFSVPVDLAAGANQLAKAQNRIYMMHFLKSLREKVRAKQALLPPTLPFDRLSKLRTFHEFDDAFTAPLHGFSSAADYYSKCSASRFLCGIKIPTLLVNAKNDPFLSAECFPREEAIANEHLFLEIPRSGGHCGFIPQNRQGECWSESRALTFLEETGAEDDQNGFPLV